MMKISKNILPKGGLEMKGTPIVVPEGRNEKQNNPGGRGVEKSVSGSLRKGERNENAQSCIQNIR